MAVKCYDNIKYIFKTYIKLHLKKDRNWGDSTVDKGTSHSGLLTQLSSMKHIKVQKLWTER